MKIKVQWTESAQFDWEQIIDFILVHNKKAAIDVYQNIKAACEKLNPNEKLGRIVPELMSQNIKFYRELIVRHWRVICKLEKNKVIILAVIDSRRDIDDALLRRSINR